jgi:predicted transcriptional regulator
MIYRRTHRYNARKLAILSAMVKAGRPMSYGEVAVAVGIFPIRQVARDLQRYVSFGIVQRRKTGQRSSYSYSLTQKGTERTAWLKRTVK